MDTVSIYFCLMFTGIFLEVIYIGIRMRGSLVSPSVSLSLAVKPLTRRATRVIFRHKMGTYELYCFVSEKAPWVWPLGSSPPPFSGSKSYVHNGALCTVLTSRTARRNCRCCRSREEGKLAHWMKLFELRIRSVRRRGWRMQNEVFFLCYSYNILLLYLVIIIVIIVCLFLHYEYVCK